MLFAQTTVCEDGILGAEVNTLNWLDHWVVIGGLIEPRVQFDSMIIEESGDGVTRARCIVLNPTVQIVEGRTFSIIWRGEIIFDGLIRTMTIDADLSESLFQYAIEADGWNSLLARRTITASYANQTAGFILRDAITASGVNADGVSAGIIDTGVSLILVEADHVRMSDFIRDIGKAGGGNAYIDVYKRIQFQPGTANVSSVSVHNARVEKVQNVGELDNYRNRQIVKVTGTGGNTVTETRNDLAQQHARILEEGGSGIYEAYETISHPTSDVSGELSILGQTESYLQLRTYSRNARRVVVTMRDPAPQFGQLVNVDLPGFGLIGTFSAMRKTWRQNGGQFLFDIELWESSFQQLALESLLKIVGVGKAVVSISANVFPNVQLFSTPGTFTWTVPGGVTTAQLTCFGGSGGGGGAAREIYPNTTVERCTSGSYYPGGGGSDGNHGGTAGNSGKAVTILAVTPGEDLTVLVGAAGATGVSDSDTGSLSISIGASVTTTATAGTSGTLSSVKRSAVVLCQGDGGTYGDKSSCTWSRTGSFIYRICKTQGADGTHGGGIGDAVSVGGGYPGGVRGLWTPFTNPTGGSAGVVEIRW